jgi:iron(II)-dependent oxidoreductase
VTIGFVLVSYRSNEPAGMERATAALAEGLRALGHRAYVISAASPSPDDTDVETLTSLPITFPCDDVTLRSAVIDNHGRITDEISRILAANHTDIVVHVDCLWGLGMFAADIGYRAQRVLAVHVLRHASDLRPALAVADQVIAPSPALLREAEAAGYTTTSWHVIPNPLLIDPTEVTRPGPAARDELRRSGPVRLISRLDEEKGIEQFLATPNPTGRPVYVALAAAGYEAESGSQHTLRARIQSTATETGAVILPPLPWRDVPKFLADAAVTVVPSLRETFGNLAAESLSAGTPVVAYRVGNLPDLIGDGGVCVDEATGPNGLWCAVQDLTADPLRYAATCEAACYRSRNYRPSHVADNFVKGVW